VDQKKSNRLDRSSRIVPRRFSIPAEALAIGARFCRKVHKGKKDEKQIARKFMCEWYLIQQVNPGSNVADNPVHAFEQMCASLGTACQDSPVMCFDRVQAEGLL
jgi:hypothetical protein